MEFRLSFQEIETTKGGEPPVARLITSPQTSFVEAELRLTDKLF